MDEKFKMPLSSYEELTKVIKAYGHADAPASLQEVSKLVGLHPTIISRNAGFLTTAGILEPGQKKVATPAGRNLAHALEHEMPEDIRKSWHSIVEATDFLSKVVTAIKIRNGMDSSTLEAHIAYSAGQPKKPAFMTGARTIIDILRAAEVVMEENGKIVYVHPGEAHSPEAPATPVTAPPVPGPSLSGPVAASPSLSPQATSQPMILERSIRTASEAGDLQIRININISCTSNDVAELESSLPKLLKKLRSSVVSTSEEHEQE